MISISWKSWWNICFFPKLEDPPLRFLSEILHDLVCPHVGNVSFVVDDFFNVQWDSQELYPLWFIRALFFHDATMHLFTMIISARTFDRTLFERDAILLILEIYYSLFPLASSILQMIWTFFHNPFIVMFCLVNLSFAHSWVLSTYLSLSSIETTTVDWGGLLVHRQLSPCLSMMIIYSSFSQISQLKSREDISSFFGTFCTAFQRVYPLAFQVYFLCLLPYWHLD